MLILIFTKRIITNNYSKDHIVFYSKKEEGSNERIARKGVLVKRENAPATIVILHGYGNDKFAVAPFRLFFKKYNCFTFDFRAHGEGIDDQYCTLGYDEVHDLFGAIDFIKSQNDLKEKPILIWAPSMGAATAIEAQAIDPTLCIGMFLDSPFPSSEEIIRTGIEKMKLGILGYEFDIPGSGLLEKHAFNTYVQSILKYLLKKVASVDATKIDTFVKPIYPIESIKNVNVPCFFSICKNDEKIPVEGVMKIFENHPGPKRLRITNGKDHCDSIFNDPEKYEKMVNDFFDEVLSGSIYNKPNEIIFKDSEDE
jgi:pimeloyl-ACP methyl ester carboxylesterase